MQKIIFTFIVLGFVACKGGQNGKGESELNGDNGTDTVSLKGGFTVMAVAQTEAVRAVEGEDAADDPAFWFNAAAPKKSLVLGSNKREGLEVYNLQGKRLAHYPTGRINNIDVAKGLLIPNQKGVIERVDIVAGTNRTYNRIDIWSIDSSGTEFQLISDTSMRSRLEEVYGFCLQRFQGKIYAWVNGKSGQVEQYLLRPKAGKVEFDLLRSMAAESQTEGMVVDTLTHKLYLGVEEAGIFVYDAKPSADNEGRYIPMSGNDNSDLQYDIEGLAIHYADNKKYLIASSQGNNRFAVYDISEGQAKYINYFEIVDSEQIDGVAETDGIDVFSGAVGACYPDGIFIAQDGFNKNEGKKLPQNFKMISLRDILKSLTINKKVKQ